MNEASEQDILLLEEWLGTSEKNRDYFNHIQQTWYNIELEKELTDTDISQDLTKVLDRIDSRAENDKFTFRSLFGNWILRGAAIFILGVATSWLLLQQQGFYSAESTVLNVVETPRGSRAKVYLPDGSKVLLNADSRLTYPQKFSKEKRSVILEGEAYFEVEKDTKRQFLVKTTDVTVKVFGTSFNVKSYPDENTTETTLVEGSVSVYKHTKDGDKVGSEYKLEPNERMVLYKEEPKIVAVESRSSERKNVPKKNAKLVLSKRIDTEKFVSWKDGQIKFDSEPLSQMSVTLERRYDVKILFEDEEITNFKFTGVFKNETIEQVMAAIKLASPIDFRIDERTIWIKKGEN